EQRPLEVDALRPELLVRRLERSCGRVVTDLDRVVAIHQDLRLDDRDEPGLLADRRVARERVGVRADATPGRDTVADRDHRSPLGKARAEADVLLAPLRQAVEPERDRLARMQRERLGTGIDLDPRDDALRGE